MNYRFSRTTRLSPLGRALLSLCVLVSSLAAAPAAASGPNGHKARLSADLSDHLNAGSQRIRIIVHGTRAEVDTLAARYNLRVTRYLESGAVLIVNAGQLEALRQDETQDHISGDIRLESSVDAITLEAIGVDQVAVGSDDRAPLSGRGITVAVIDSGIDTRHSALRKRVLLTKDFTGGDGMDRFGHGTHVAAIIAGQSGRTTETREQRGVAPGAWLLNLRVLGDDGSGVASDVIDAIDWTVAHRHEYNVQVINLSLGAPVMQPYRDDPLCEAVERAVRAGIVVVAAAGNYGRKADGTSVYGGIATPGNSPFAITVGALDTHGTAIRSDDTLAPYSSKGPTRYDLVLKPDVSAPGSHISSAEAQDSYLSKTYPERHVAGSGTNGYMQLSGTSMAAGVVSGAVAILLDGRPSLNPENTRGLLGSTSSFMAVEGVLGAGAGEINVSAASLLASAPAKYDAREITTVIAGESQFVSVLLLRDRRGAQSIIWGVSNDGDSIIWGTSVKGQAIIWGATGDGDSIIWGTSVKGQAIIWGAASDGDSIIWGTSVKGQAIIWGAADDGDSIIWGTSLKGQSIIWGTSNDGDSIIWGTAVQAQSIIWGASGDGDSILWGTNSGDSILWGASDGDSIIWGTAFVD
jgi:serine protease AprX